MGKQLKSTLAVAVQMVTPFRKPCDLVSSRVSVSVNLVFLHLFKSSPELCGRHLLPSLRTKTKNFSSVQVKVCFYVVHKNIGV